MTAIAEIKTTINRYRKQHGSKPMSIYISKKRWRELVVEMTAENADVRKMAKIDRVTIEGIEIERGDVESPLCVPTAADYEAVSFRDGTFKRLGIIQ